MNERIRQLAAQARSLGNDEALYLERVHNRTYTIDEVNEIHYQKFAQLIVAECALQCVHNEDMDLIEKHFGVEL
jgi:geranylgeranyl pyrophosphate synthase